MTTRLVSRIRRLEGGTGSRCPACGFDGDWSKVKFHIEDRGNGKPERCGTCGRPTRIVLTWGRRYELHPREALRAARMAQDGLDVPL